MKPETWQEFWKCVWQGLSTKEETREYLNKFTIQELLDYDLKHPIFQETAHQQTPAAEATWDLVAEHTELIERVHDIKVTCKYHRTAFEHLNLETREASPQWKKSMVEKLYVFRKAGLACTYVTPMASPFFWNPPESQNKRGWMKDF